MYLVTLDLASRSDSDELRQTDTRLMIRYAYNSSESFREHVGLWDGSIHNHIQIHSQTLYNGTVSLPTNILPCQDSSEEKEKTNMASWERRNETLSREALTLEEWILNSGVKEALTTCNQNVTIDFLHEMRRGQSIPSCVIRLNISNKQEGWSCIQSLEWEITSNDYTVKEIWKEISSYIQKLELTSIPDFILLSSSSSSGKQLSQLHHLCLRGKRSCESPDFGSILDEDENEDDYNNNDGSEEEDDVDRRQEGDDVVVEEEEAVVVAAVVLEEEQDDVVEEEHAEDEVSSHHEFPTRIESTEQQQEQQQNSLFNKEEIIVLINFLNPPTTITTTGLLKSLECSLCFFGQDMWHPFINTLSTNQTLHRITFDSCTMIGRERGGEKTNIRHVVHHGDDKTGNALHMLTIRECTLDDGAMEGIVQLLTSSPSLEHLSFLKSEAPLFAGRFIATSLLSQSHLQSLDLSGLDTGDDGMEAIGNLLRESQRISHLYLSEMPQSINLSCLEDAFASNSTLISLDLSSNRLSNTDTLFIALQQNNTLQELNLSRCTWDDNDDSSHGPDNDNISMSSFFRALGGCRGLLHLDLSNTYLSSEDISDLAFSLSENKYLERLLLNSLDQTFEDIRLEQILLALRDNKHLRIFELGQNTLRKDDLQTLIGSLSVNQSLESLTLSGCGLTDDGILQLAPFLPHFSIHDLDLSFNGFGRRGAEAIYEVLTLDTKVKDRNLRTLSLYNSCWSVGGPTHFECSDFGDINQDIQDILQKWNG